MSTNYAELVGGYDEAPELHGSEQGEVLPAGWYPMRVVAIERGETKSGIPSVRMQLAVREGEPYGNRRVFDDAYLGASKSKKDKAGNEFERSPEEFDKALKSVQGRLKGFLSALGVHKSTPTASPSTADFLYQHYSVDQWEGREFMGQVSVEKSEQYGDKNRLKAFHSLNDEKKGYGAWVSGNWGKAKLMAAMTKGNSTGAGSAAMTV